MNCPSCGNPMIEGALVDGRDAKACLCGNFVFTTPAMPPHRHTDTPEKPKGTSGRGKAWKGPERAEYGKRGGEERAKRPGPCVLPPNVSPIEEALAIQIKAAGLPTPEREYRFAPPRRWKFDFCWPDRMIAVECEGGTRQLGRHNRHEGFEADCQKYNAAARLDWVVLRYTGGMVNSGEALRDLEEMLK